MAQIFPIDFEEKLTMAQDDYILFSDSEDGNKIKKAQYKNLKGEQGTPGTPGKDGEDGAAATITVGSTTTGTPGSSASVTNSGTSSAAVLDFTIPQGAKGEPGVDGQDGADGASATITVGTTTTLPAGSSATVENVGTSQDAILNFGIPKGDQGVGSGDVNGPASSTDGDVAIFDGSTGKLIKDGSVALSTLSSAASLATTAIQPGDDISDLNNDSGFITGITSSDVTNALGYTPYDASNPSGYTTNTGDVVGPASSTNGHLAVFDGTTGKLIKDGGAIPTGVPAVGSNGQVLTVVSGAAARANASGGDVLVSTQANNIFTPGMKIWGGTTSDFNDLTPDSNTAYLLLADQPTPPSPGWQPGVNTVAYYPLTTVSTVNDESGNSHTMSQSGGTFGIYQGVDCLNLSTSDYLSCTIAQLPQGNDPVTISCWVYFITNDTTQNHGLFGYGQNGYHASFQFYASNAFAVRTYHDDASILRDNSYLGKRLYLTGTSDGTDVKFYINGQMMVSNSHSQNMQDTNLYIGKGIVDYGLDGYISNCIVENVARTAQEIEDYFNQTKANYGIS